VKGFDVLFQVFHRLVRTPENLPQKRMCLDGLHWLVSDRDGGTEALVDDTPLDAPLVPIVRDSKIEMCLHPVSTLWASAKARIDKKHDRIAYMSMMGIAGRSIYNVPVCSKRSFAARALLTNTIKRPSTDIDVTSPEPSVVMFSFGVHRSGPS
jgi:hypothetical protein